MENSVENCLQYFIRALWKFFTDVSLFMLSEEMLLFCCCDSLCLYGKKDVEMLNMISAAGRGQNLDLKLIFLSHMGTTALKMERNWQEGF